MKKTIYSLLAITALLFSSCESFTELEPKGKNLLTTTDQLEMLLNKEYEGCSSDMRQMAGDMIYAYSNVATIISQPVKTRNVIIWTYDEANMDKMAELTSSDQDYTNFYGYIGTIANPILSKIDAASGTEADKKLLKSEALTLRAWSFYMLVNKFAKAYNPATAATDPGIILMTEDKDIQTAQSKSTCFTCLMASSLVLTVPLRG
jgi:starch-binding outer membrane protein, SusD/RagB family